MQWAHQKQRGFTIVELLIVVVVIAILAAITIVAYTGIQNRTKESALQSATSQAAKKILTYAPLNADQYPLKSTYRSDLNLSADTDQAIYDYFVSNDRKAFCLSVTNPTLSGGVSYAQTQSANNIVGRCVENLLVNPSFENGIVGWSAANGATPSVNSAAAMTGANGVTVTTSSASDSGIGRNFTFSTNTKYAMTCMIRLTGTTSYNFSSSAQATGITGGTQTRILSGGQQARIGRVLTTASTTAGGMAYCLRVGGQSGEATYHVDGVMLTQTDQIYSYGDGNSTNWSWTGDPATSTSFGPATIQQL